MEHGNQLKLDACPYCGIANPNLYPWGAHNGASLFDTTAADGKNNRRWGTYRCASCGGVILAAARVISSTLPVGQAFLQVSPIDLILPKPRIIPAEIPDRARAYLVDAAKTLAAPAASLMVSASAVDSMLKAKGYKDGNLYNRINQAADDHVVTKEMAEWAHHVRLEANGQRHADDEETIPTKVEAERSLEFALALAEFLFVLPARVTRGLKQTEELATAKR